MHRPQPCTFFCLSSHFSQLIDLGLHWTALHRAQAIPFLERVTSLENIMNAILEKMELMEIHQVRLLIESRAVCAAF